MLAVLLPRALNSIVPLWQERLPATSRRRATDALAAGRRVRARRLASAAVDSNGRDATRELRQ